jgi:hypothetical protein
MKLFYVPVTSASISHSAICNPKQTTLKYACNFEDFIEKFSSYYWTQHRGSGLITGESFYMEDIVNVSSTSNM